MFLLILQLCSHICLLVHISLINSAKGCSEIRRTFFFLIWYQLTLVVQITRLASSFKNPCNYVPASLPPSHWFAPSLAPINYVLPQPLIFHNQSPLLVSLTILVLISVLVIMSHSVRTYIHTPYTGHASTSLFFWTLPWHPWFTVSSPIDPPFFISLLLAAFISQPAPNDHFQKKTIFIAVSVSQSTQPQFSDPIHSAWLTFHRMTHTDWTHSAITHFFLLRFHLIYHSKYLFSLNGFS